MRILLDECIDWRLGRAIASHDVQSVHQVGWARYLGSSASERASGNYDVFITVDRNLTVQQQVSRYHLGVVVLSAHSNRLSDLESLVPELLAALPIARRGEALVVGIGRPLSS